MHLLIPQRILKAFVSCIYPKGMVAITVLSEDNLSAHLAVQLASHFKEKAGLWFCRLLAVI